MICPNKTIYWDVNWYPTTITGFDTYFTQCGTSSVDFTPETTKFTTIYPNPASTQTTIDFYVDFTSTISVDVYSASGQKVYSASTVNVNPGFQYLTLSLDDLANGIYVVKLMQNFEPVDIRMLSVIK